MPRITRATTKRRKMNNDDIATPPDRRHDNSMNKMVIIDPSNVGVALEFADSCIVCLNQTSRDILVEQYKSSIARGSDITYDKIIILDPQDQDIADNTKFPNICVLVLDETTRSKLLEYYCSDRTSTTTTDAPDRSDETTGSSSTTHPLQKVVVKNYTNNFTIVHSDDIPKDAIVNRITADQSLNESENKQLIKDRLDQLSVGEYMCYEHPADHPAQIVVKKEEENNGSTSSSTADYITDYIESTIKTIKKSFLNTKGKQPPQISTKLPRDSKAPKKNPNPVIRCLNLNTEKDLFSYDATNFVEECLKCPPLSDQEKLEPVTFLINASHDPFAESKTDIHPTLTVSITANQALKFLRFRLPILQRKFDYSQPIDLTDKWYLTGRIMQTIVDYVTQHENHEDVYCNENLLQHQYLMCGCSIDEYVYRQCLFNPQNVEVDHVHLDQAKQNIRVVKDEDAKNKLVAKLKEETSVTKPTVDTSEPVTVLTEAELEERETKLYECITTKDSLWKPYLDGDELSVPKDMASPYCRVATNIDKWRETPFYARDLISHDRKGVFPIPHRDYVHVDGAHNVLLDQHDTERFDPLNTAWQDLSQNSIIFSKEKAAAIKVPFEFFNQNENLTVRPQAECLREYPNPPPPPPTAPEINMKLLPTPDGLPPPTADDMEHSDDDDEDDDNNDDDNDTTASQEMKSVAIGSGSMLDNADNDSPYVLIRTCKPLVHLMKALHYFDIPWVYRKLEDYIIHDMEKELSGEELRLRFGLVADVTDEEMAEFEADCHDLNKMPDYVNPQWIPNRQFPQFDEEGESLYPIYKKEDDEWLAKMKIYIRKPTRADRSILSLDEKEYFGNGDDDTLQLGRDVWVRWHCRETAQEYSVTYDEKEGHHYPEFYIPLEFMKRLPFYVESMNMMKSMGLSVDEIRASVTRVHGVECIDFDFSSKALEILALYLCYHTRDRCWPHSIGNNVNPDPIESSEKLKEEVTPAPVTPATADESKKPKVPLMYFKDEELLVCGCNARELVFNTIDDARTDRVHHIRNDFWYWTRAQYHRGELFDYHLMLLMRDNPTLMLECERLAQFVRWVPFMNLINRYIMEANRQFRSFTQCEMFWKQNEHEYIQWCYRNLPRDVLNSVTIENMSIIPV